MMNKIIFNILDQIPIQQIYKYLSEKESTLKATDKNPMSASARKKAKDDSIKLMVREIALGKKRSGR